MPTAYDIAGVQYSAPTNEPAGETPWRLNYSIHAGSILPFLAFHRVALASQVQRAFPHSFASDRSVRRHLQTLVDAKDLTCLTYDDPRRPNIYVITDQGLDRACDYLPVVPECIPAHHEEPTGDHVLHELLVTQVAVARYEFFRGNGAYRHLWEERYGLHSIPAFADVVPDYAQAFRGPHGSLFDFVEVLSGERSITRVQEKLRKWADWSENAEARQFLIDSYRRFGAANPKPVFRLTIVVHNRKVVGTDQGWERQILSATFSLPPELQQRIWTTTNAALRHTDSIDSHVWRSASLLTPHRDRWHETPKSRRIQLVSELLAKQPTVPLFSFTP
jgi:protein involved in plasmid replication-relaxation